MGWGQGGKLGSDKVSLQGFDCSCERQLLEGLKLARTAQSSFFLFKHGLLACREESGRSDNLYHRSFLESVLSVYSQGLFTWAMEQIQDCVSCESFVCLFLSA